MSIAPLYNKKKMAYKTKLQGPEPPRPDQKTVAWQERNQWWGVDEEMTALALGYHQKLEKQYGRQYVGTDEYWQNVDNTMRRRFPEYFGEKKRLTGVASLFSARRLSQPRWLHLRLVARPPKR
jgi:hypothetical protein